MKRVGLCLLLAAVAVSAASYPNPITDDELVSVVTSSIDPFFYKVGSEVGTDKVSKSKNFCLFSQDLVLRTSRDSFFALSTCTLPSTAVWSWKYLK